MRNPILRLLIGSLLLLLCLVACSQINQQEALASDVDSLAQIIPSNPSGSKSEEPGPGIAAPELAAAQKEAPTRTTATILPTTAPTVVPTIVNLTPLPPIVSGIIQDTNGPIAGAVVQIQRTSTQTKTWKDGTFRLGGITGTTPIIITAWAEGYYVGWIAVNPSAPDWKGSDQLKITLKPLPENDNVEYPWFSFERRKGVGQLRLMPPRIQRMAGRCTFKGSPE